MLGYYLVLLVVCSIFIPRRTAWETPSPHQYHIQTDEGPERYFRYQTDSGQYRKEKRLEDGTVVGTYAWIDADGVLRQRDYIADNAGYRILKNKNVFVGRNINVGDAVKTAKKYPADSGTLVNSRPVLNVPYNAHPSYNYLPSSTPSPIPSYSYIPSSTPSPLPSYSYIPSTTASPLAQNTPISSYLPSTTASPAASYLPSTTPTIPSSTYLPSSSPYPTSSTVSPLVDVSPNSIDSSTPFRIVIPTEPPNSGVVEITPNSFLGSPYEEVKIAPLRNVTYLAGNHLQSTVSAKTYYSDGTFSTTIAPLYSPSDFGGSQEVDHNSLEYNPYVRHVQNNYRFQNGPTYPLDKNGRPYIGQVPKAKTYDGVSVTNDGFRYYIPRAYHEEQTLPGDKRSGSFGYIDPFGIRRVIYYNASPGTGFQHRKNNRYVGFNAPPYDPRPY
ncbi:unnamed protein product [Phyllotreta striolata]|uniref:Uncharacterized protein n=1 Tax=Phyllotreta striolata TaxID=444603 RepID=A0A9P0DU49_PHYSR|nr:unnamed protein product [Phyllotreta striolata]